MNYIGNNEILEAVRFLAQRIKSLEDEIKLLKKKKEVGCKFQSKPHKKTYKKNFLEKFFDVFEKKE